MDTNPKPVVVPVPSAVPQTDEAERKSGQCFADAGGSC